MRHTIAVDVILLSPNAASAARVKTGLDVLVRDNLAPLAGKRVALITNHSGLTSDGRRNIDLLYKSGTVKLVAIFTPEHGLTGLRDDPNIGFSVDPVTDVPVRSLFDRQTRRMTPDMLKDIDALVYDIQDVGARFYTFITTLGYTLEAAAQAHVAYYVLDRPNPINGVAVEGPPLDEKYVSFVAYMPGFPIRHGMTVGELAQFYNGEKKLNADLHVIKMEGWNRRMWFDETGLMWVNPSPALRSLSAAILYPGTCLLESRQVSVGRGTDTPFQMVGAPWFKAGEMAEYLNSLKVPGVSFIPRHFQPNGYIFKDQDCQGVDIQLLDRNALDAVRMGLELLHATLKFHSTQFDLNGVMRLLGNDDAAARLKRGETGSEVSSSFQSYVEQFRKRREKYLLY
jgi:uncharacterized protein YbbC (DUF1343 family)